MRTAAILSAYNAGVNQQRQPLEEGLNAAINACVNIFRLLNLWDDQLHSHMPMPHTCVSICMLLPSYRDLQPGGGLVVASVPRLSPFGAKTHGFLNRSYDDWRSLARGTCMCFSPDIHTLRAPSDIVTDSSQQCHQAWLPAACCWGSLPQFLYVSPSCVAYVCLSLTWRAAVSTCPD